MAQVSKRLRRARRTKRDLSKAARMLDFALFQRDQARTIAGAIEQELKKREAQPALTITKIPDELDVDHEESVQAAKELAARDE